MADRLGLPLQSVQRATTSREFVEWQEYEEIEASEGFHRQDHYFAQLTAEIVKGRVKNPTSIKMKDYILNFRRQKPSTPKTDKESAQARLNASKAAWCAGLGVKPV